MIVKINRQKTVGVFGAKGSGKTWITRELAESVDKDGICFNTIGALKPKGYKEYIVSNTRIAEQAMIFAGICNKTHKNVCVDLRNLNKAQIILFTDTFLKATHLKSKWIFIDEIVDYVPEIGKRSQELERFIRNCRNDECTVVLNTQRPPVLSKTVLNLCDIVFIFRLNWVRDLSVVREVLSGLGIQNEEIENNVHKIANLDTGEKKLIVFGRINVTNETKDNNV